MTPAPLPVNVLCGYLGAGKTTLLNRLLAGGDQRILVMVNDFGDVAVDAALISARSADTIQLSNGCICCSMAGGMFDAFERALEWRGRVDRLVIEASGVAEPARLAAFARAEPDMDCRAVVVVIDPTSVGTRLEDPRVGDVVRRQIEGADIAVLSRRDRLSDGALHDVVALATAINPSLLIHAGDEPGLLAAMDTPHSDLSPAVVPGHVSHGQIFARATIRDDMAPTREGFLRLLKQAAPDLHRAKGFVRFADETAPTLVQLAGGEVVLSAPPADPGAGPAIRLVLIGPDAAALARFQDDLALCVRQKGQARAAQTAQGDTQ